jgi:sulfonate transport system substrate-binding protein
MLSSAAVLALLSIVGAEAFADPAKVVRIASIGTLEDGKVVVTSQSARVQQEGWLDSELKKRGVKLEWYPVATGLGGPGFNEALASRKVDFASYGDLPSIIAKSAGVDIKLIVPYGGATHSYLVVGRHVQAKTIKDLRGKRIALQRGRPGELPFTRLVNANGMTLKDFRILNLPYDAADAALVAGNTDAVFGRPTAYLLEDRGLGRIIWSTKDTPAGSVSWNTRVDLYARSEFAAQNPGLAELVATAYVKAAHWVTLPENYDAVVKIYTRGGLTESTVRRDFDGQPTPWKERWAPLFDANLYQYFDEAVRLSYEKQLIRRTFSSAELFDERYARAAVRNLKLDNYWTPQQVTHRQQQAQVR